MRTYNNIHQAEKPKSFTDIRDLFRSSAQVFGDKVQYFYRDDALVREFTYNDFWSTMREFGTALFDRGLSNAHVAVVGDTHPYWVTTFTSVISTGGVIVPLDHELDIDEMINFMRRAECTAVVYTGSMNGRLTSRMNDLPFIKYFIPISPPGEDFSGGRVMSYEDFLTEGRAKLETGDTRFEDHEISMDEMCAILFTSGTTGSSKGVMLSHRNLTAAADAACRATRFDRNSRFVSVLPIHHTYELTCAHLAHGNLGCTSYINESLRYATRNFKEFKPNSLILVPLFLETIHRKIWDEIRKKKMEKKVRSAMAIALTLLKTGVDVREKMFSEITAAFGGKLKYIIVGGAPIDPQIIKDFYAFGITICQGYGITECSPLVAVNRPGAVKFDSVGQVVDNCEVRIDPVDGCSQGEGEIVVRGQNVMLGYYRDADATRRAFTEDGWFRTGDIGTVDRHGYITITGRKKNVIIASNGKNVFPEELEERLARLPEVRESVVLSREGENGVTIVAIIVPEIAEDGDYSALSERIKEGIAKINRSLPSYKHIGKFEIRSEEFEKTPSKKIKRFLLH